MLVFEELLTRLDKYLGDTFGEEDLSKLIRFDLPVNDQTTT